MEALIAVSIFVVLGTLAGTMYVQNVKNYKGIRVEKELMADAQFIMERLSKEFQDSTIDYEEYYNRIVLEDDYGGYDEDTGEYDNYGEYGKRFYNDDNINTGQNPPLGFYSEDNQKDASAVCDPYNVDAQVTAGCLAVADKDYWEQDALYLITGDGKEKKMFVWVGGKLEYLKMVGNDDENDGIMDSYTNSTETPSGLVPLSPSRTEIKKLKFYISPLEDPYRAFAEQNLTVQMQPHVTIYLEVGPAGDNQGGLNKDNLPHLEIQTTLSSRVYNEVKSYKP